MTLKPAACPFCAPAAWIPVAENDLAVAFRDGYPVTQGHTLIITRRHVPDFFACTPPERAALLELVDRVKADLDQLYQPHGYNVGFNAGEAAGQTVMHVHLHVIPRYRGDVEDPRGGVRYVVPDKANYLRKRAEILTDGDRGGSFYAALAPLLARATHIDVLAAFIQDSGLTLIEPAVQEALRRGANLRILTGDYLDITQVDALRRLLDWVVANGAERSSDTDSPPGELSARVIETARLGGRAFHPKAWHLKGADFGAAFVGSSNLSRSALVDGVEWNLRVDRHRDEAAWERVASSYQRLWDAATDIDAAWIAAYAQRARTQPLPRPLGELDDPVRLSLPPPTRLQQEALEALAASRRELRRRALIVMATGLGKTVLAALDIAAVCSSGGRPPAVLWLAHRRELLEQAASTLRAGLPEARFAWVLEGQRAVEPFDVLFASVQSLSRPSTLREIPHDRFDYVVVDEVHHADAPSYRRILEHFSSAFLLGLTATPERADGGDIEGLFDDHIAYRADIGLGIDEDLLVPFTYFGLADTTNYTPIPFRGGRFDLAELSIALATEARMEKLWTAWNEPGKQGSRTMVFCASIAHARFVRDWLSARGVRTRLCHGGADSDDRSSSLQELEVGEIDAICSVDLFNEGIDCRPIDRVVMLRPTESSVLFLQQLGRGLRKAKDKARLTVIDFVGNHRIFLEHLRVLLAMGTTPTPLSTLVATVGELVLPQFTVNLELEAKDLLRFLLPRSRGTTPLVAQYREIVAARGERPSAGELMRLDLRWNQLPPTHKDWFSFVESEGDLSEAESATLRVAQSWLSEVQTTAMTRCYKAVVLQVLIDADALQSGMSLEELERRSHAFLLRSPELFEDLVGVKALPDPHHPDPGKWRAYWRKNPIKHWCMGKWFTLEGDWFKPLLPEADPLTLAAMTRELVDARLVEYRRTPRKQMEKEQEQEQEQTMGQLIPLPSALARFISFPTLRAAAGWDGAGSLSPEAQEVLLPGEPKPTQFAVRIAGHSMEGGHKPIHDGDWAIFEHARGQGLSAAEGRVALVGLGAPDEGPEFHVKRVLRSGDGYLLASDNPALAPRPAEHAELYATLHHVVRPEQLAPPIGSTSPDIRATFGLSQTPTAPISRVDGHLFLLADGEGVLTAPGRWDIVAPRRGPGETAYVLSRPEPSAPWRYLGVAHWSPDLHTWTFPTD